MEPWGVTIVGGGGLGTSIAYWLAQRYEGRIAVLEKEVDVAAHTSRRNTGVVHRPFYLDPVGRKVFARCAQVAYGMWKAYAAARGLPRLGISTFEVALREEDQARLEKYRQWGLANGMREDELELLTSSDVRRYEPNVRCHGRSGRRRTRRSTTASSRNPCGTTPRRPGRSSSWEARSPPSTWPATCSRSASPRPRRSASTSIRGGRSLCTSGADGKRIARGS